MKKAGLSICISKRKPPDKKTDKASEQVKELVGTLVPTHSDRLVNKANCCSSRVISEVSEESSGGVTLASVNRFWLTSQGSESCCLWS